MRTHFPPDEIRDLLYGKLGGKSVELAHDLAEYRRWPDNHPSKTAQFLISAMDRCIQEKQKGHNLEKRLGVNKTALATPPTQPPGPKAPAAPGPKAKGKANNKAAASTPTTAAPGEQGETRELCYFSLAPRLHAQVG